MPENIKKIALSGIGISLIAGLVLTVLAPYGTNNFAIYWRLIYWTGLCIIGAIGAQIFLPIAHKFGLHPSAFVTVLGQSVTASIAVIACLIGLDLTRGDVINPQNILILFALVWVIGIVIAGVANMADRVSNSPSAKESRPAIYERIKPALRDSEIYALTSEDHYVRVITSKGEDLILMRLSDAAKELGSLKGLSVHRSWWVAEAGVKFIKKSDGKMSLELHSGQIAPVSRSNQKSVREAGWT